jgi:hypothetical protein
MCDLTDPSVSAAPNHQQQYHQQRRPRQHHLHHHHHRHSNEGTSRLSSHSSHYSIDAAPGVVSPGPQGWSDRPLIDVTPQHVATLHTSDDLSTLTTATAPPMLMDNSYVYVQAHGNVLYFWCISNTLQQFAEGSLQECSAVAATYASLSQFKVVVVGDESCNAIIQLCELPSSCPSSLLDSKALALAPDEMHSTSVSRLLALTTTGDIYVVAIHDHSHGEVMTSWSTRKAGATSITAILMNTVSATTTVDTATSQSWNVIVGYSSGYLQSWTLKGPSSKGVVLNWMGFFEHYYCIRHLQELRMHQQASVGDNAASQPSPSSSETSPQPTLLPHTYLLLTFQPTHTIPTASALEVLDLYSIEQAWKGRKDVDAIPLEPHWVLAAPGREILDANATDRVTATSSRSARPHPMGSRIPSSTSDCIVPLYHPHESWAAAVGLSDGTVALISTSTTTSSPPESDNDTTSLAWGIDSHTQDQMLFSYPCIGMGVVELNMDGSSLPHVACALRGGSVYMVPLAREIAHTFPLRVFSYPAEPDSDAPAMYLQSFTACTVPTPRKGSIPYFSQAQIPLVFFSWPGGIVEIYSCELLQKHPTLVALHDMMTNDTAKELIELILTMDAPLHDAWQAARHEIIDQGRDSLTLDSLCGPSWNAFRELLLQLAVPTASLPEMTHREKLSAQ